MINSLAGEKHIYYDGSGNFSSDIGKFINENTEINKEAIYDFLIYGTVLPPNSIYNDVWKMFPGEEIDDRLNKNNNQYRNLAEVKMIHRNIDYFVDEVDRLLQEYFDNILNSGKDISLSLSGGLDSAILASYLPKNTHCITWAGWGLETTDYIYAKKVAKHFGFKNHTVAKIDYREDEELFQDLIKITKEPFKVASVSHYKMAREVSREQGEILIVGDNADTIAGSFGEVVYSYFLTKTNLLLKYFPWEKIYNNYKRKFFLLSTTNPIELAAFLHSNGVYPGSWININKGYFDKKKEQVEMQIGHKIRGFNDYILMGMLMTGVMRQTSIIRNLSMSIYGIDYVMPYSNKDIVEKFLQVPFSIKRKNFFNKVVLRKLAEKRGVPMEIIYRPKKGMSYGYKDYIKERRHIPTWDLMEGDINLNKFINVKLIRKKNQDNFTVFDTLRSLYYFLKNNSNII